MRMACGLSVVLAAWSALVIAQGVETAEDLLTTPDKASSYIVPSPSIRVFSVNPTGRLVFS